MKISIVIPVLNSHEVVRRQIEHFKKMNLSDDIEIIFMDDGSNPPLAEKVTWGDVDGFKNFNIYATGEKRPWTECLARNKGAKVARGEYLLMTDIDHILTRELIDGVYKFEGDMMSFPRFLAILDEEGNFTQNVEVLFKYGLSRQFYKRRGLNAGRHGNSFAIRKAIFDEMGGYSERVVLRPWHEGADRYFKREWRKGVAAGRWKQEESGPPMYTFPIGRFCGDGTDIDCNPLGLFNNLKREMVPQPMKE